MLKKIHVFGPTCIDHTIKLKDIISLDGTSRIDNENLSPGGTGLCYAVALARLQNKVVLHTVLGNDKNTQIIINLLKSETNIENQAQCVTGKTDHAYIMIDSKNHKTVASHKLISNEFKVNQVSTDSLAKTKAIVLSSFNNVLVAEIIKKVVRHVFPKPYIFWAPHTPNCKDAVLLLDTIKYIDHISLSENEFKELTTRMGNPLDRGVGAITVTNGKQGSRILSRLQNTKLSAYKILENPLDTNGAGEAFGAAFLTTYLATKDYKTSAVAGSYAGYLHVQRPASDFPYVSKRSLLNAAYGFKSRNGDNNSAYI